MSKKLEPTATQPFGVGEKSLICQEKGRSTVDLDTRNDLHKMTHLIRHRIGTPVSGQSVFFETGLRTYGNKNEGLRALEKKWTNMPKIDKSWEPSQLYPSYEETKNIKSWSTKNLTIKTHSAFDGHTNFPTYGERKSAPKNLAETGHLYTASGQTMPLLNWQLSMRSYGNIKKIALSPNANTEGSLGELKKVNRKPKRV